MIDPEEIYANLRARGDKWADADAAYKALDDVTKTVLAECEIEARKDPECSTQAAIERHGRVHQVFRSHIAKVGEARKAANRARVSYDTYQAYVELLRTKAANERAEMNLR
jgi:hypothetical protein